MLKTLRYISAAIAILLLAGCSDDDLLRTDRDDADGELPVEFSFEWPGITETRGFDDATVKTKFTDGDVIHVVGTFKTSALQTDGSYKDGTTARYGALKYNGKTRQWEAVAGNKLTWPSISTEGKFYAYYLSSTSGMFTSYDSPVTVSLSDVTPESDPLMAPETAYMQYGHAVKLQFEHLCTYLTLVDLEPMVATNYFFYAPIVGTEDGGSKPFNNAFSLTLVANTDSDDPDLLGTPQLKFNFTQVENAQYDNRIFISGRATSGDEEDEEGEMRTVTKVGYFLEPGTYNTFKVEYSAIAPQTYEYLSYNYSDIPPAVEGVEYENIPPDLEAGRTYTLTVTKSPGITIVSPPSGEGWDEETPPADVDVRDFLDAVRNSRGYTNQHGTEILEAVPGGTRLLTNVDFGNYNYEDFSNELGFMPDVLQGQTFDGDYHYIKNLGCPLFRYNYGTITNLGIENVNFTAVSQEYSYGNVERDEDRSRHGAVCMWNRPEGTINNVRVSDVTMNIEVVYTNDSDDGGEVHNIGGITGSNTGRLISIAMGGTFNITVGGSDVQNAEVLIGGVCGQNAGEGRINDISMLDDDFAMNITNNCTGNLGSYSVGGIVGASSGYISGVILSDVAIKAARSSGVVSNIGGMAGKLDVSENSTAYMTSCILSGSIEAGTTKAYDYIRGQAYTGGMAGYDNNVPVTGCRSSVSVSGAPSVEDNVIYGTGGAFGIIAKPSTFSSLIAYGAKLQAPGGQSNVGSNFIGNFAGIGPAGQDWDKDYANNNIIFRSFNLLDPIGTYM